MVVQTTLCFNTALSKFVTTSPVVGACIHKVYTIEHLAGIEPAYPDYKSGTSPFMFQVHIIPDAALTWQSRRDSGYVFTDTSLPTCRRIYASRLYQEGFEPSTLGSEDRRSKSTELLVHLFSPTENPLSSVS